MTVCELLNILGTLPKGVKLWGVDLSEFGSDRGDYESCFIGQHDKKYVIIDELITFLEEKVVGQKFSGYKGGEFYMDMATEIKLGTYGVSSYPIDGVLVKTEYGEVKYFLKPLRMLTY